MSRRSTTKHRLVLRILGIVSGKAEGPIAIGAMLFVVVAVLAGLARGLW